MPIPTNITDLSPTASSNSPSGNENPIEGDNHLRTAYAFIRQLYDGATGAAYATLADLANTTDAAKGAFQIGRGFPVVDSITALRACLKTNPAIRVFVTGYYAAGDGGGGAYWYDSTDTTSADNGGTIIVATDGGRWKLQIFGAISFAQAGCKCDGVTDDTVQAQKAINTNGVGVPIALYVPEGKTMRINGTLFVPPLVTIDLNGSIIRGNDTNTIFETGYWSGGVVVSNFGQPNESQIVYKSEIRNGLITNCLIACRFFNFCEGSALHNIRFSSVDQALYAKRCFYGSFRRLLIRTPLTAIGAQTLAAYHLDDSVNAIDYQSVFAVGYKEGHRISGTKDNFKGYNCGAEACTTGVIVLNSSSAMSFDAWYFENTTTALSFDAGGNHENIEVGATWFNTVTTAITGTTVLSGVFKQNNRLGGATISLGANNSNRMVVEIPNDTTSTASTQPAVPAGYTLGDTNRTDYVKTLFDSGSGLAVSKAEVHSGINPMLYGGGSGSPSSGTVPWCTVAVTATTITIDTRITFTNFEFINYMFSVTDGGAINLAGRVVFGTVFPETGFSSKTVTASSNAGFLRLTISGLTAASAVIGLVRHQ